MDSQELFRSMPKAELHAHLSGSLSCKTVEELIELHRKTFPDEKLPAEADAFKNLTAANASFDATYAIFRVAQSIVDHPAAVELAATRVIEEFRDDGVAFLELRSTPRQIDGKMSKEEYVEAVVSAIKKCNTEPNSSTIIVKYLVSIDRRGSVADAEEALKLCLDMKARHSEVVVGLDLSGDARVNHLADFLPVLKSGKDRGLFVTVHLAEVPNVEEISAFFAADFRPDRIGHGSCIHPDFGGDESLWKTFLKFAPPIPVEICLTSNLVSVLFYQK